MSSMVSGLSEDSAGFPIIGTDLSEPSANLPGGAESLLRLIVHWPAPSYSASPERGFPRFESQHTIQTFPCIAVLAEMFPREARRAVVFKRSGSRPSVVAFTVAALGGNFNRVASKQCHQDCL